MGSDRIADVTALIDAALDGNERQRTTEQSYGDDIGGCWRCAAPAAEDSCPGLCGGCRSFLLEDTEEDPAVPRWMVESIEWTWASEPAEVTMEAIALRSSTACSAWMWSWTPRLDAEIEPGTWRWDLASLPY